MISFPMEYDIFRYYFRWKRYNMILYHIYVYVGFIKIINK